MKKRYPKRRDRIELRVKHNFTEIDLKFQQYCIDERKKESKVIRDLIENKMKEIETERGKSIVVRIVEPLEKYVIITE